MYSYHTTVAFHHRRTIRTRRREFPPVECIHIKRGAHYYDSSQDDHNIHRSRKFHTQWQQMPKLSHLVEGYHWLVFAPMYQLVSGTHPLMLSWLSFFHYHVLQGDQAAILPTFSVEWPNLTNGL